MERTVAPFCQWCARYAKQLDLLHEAGQHMDEHGDEIGAPALDDEAKARMKRALQKQVNGGL